MTTRALHVIWSPEDRSHLARVIMDPQRAPNGSRIEFKAMARTLGQNTRLWGTLTSISEQVTWHGVKLMPEDWKILFVAKIMKLRIVPNLDGDGFVALGASTSEMSRDQFDNLQEAIYEFGAAAGVAFKEPRETPPERRIVTKPPKQKLLEPPREKETVF